MNLITETRYKLNYHKVSLESLQAVDASKLTKDARHYVEDEITKSKRNIKYYDEILKILESEK